MVSVVEHLLCNSESLVKGHPLHRQQPDQLRNGNDRMGIVQLDGNRLCQIIIAVMCCPVFAQNIRQRGGAEEILLLQPQPLPLRGVVVRVEEAGDGVVVVVGLLGQGVVAPVEGGQIQPVVQRLGAPEPQPVDAHPAVCQSGL